MVDFSEFDNDFKPEDAFSGGKAEDLTDGDYELLIKDAKQKEAKGKGMVELKLEVLTPGKHEGAAITDAIWLTSQDAVKRFGAILKRFGFDSDDWKPANERPFSKEFPKALRWLVGMKVKAKKTTTTQQPKFKNDVVKTYHNLNYGKRCEGEDAQPRAIGAEELNQPDPNAAAAEADPFA